MLSGTQAFTHSTRVEFVVPSTLNRTTKEENVHKMGTVTCIGVCKNSLLYIVFWGGFSVKTILINNWACLQYFFQSVSLALSTVASLSSTDSSLGCSGTNNLNNFNLKIMQLN